MAMLLGHPRFHSVVAEQDGRIVDSNLLDERSSVHGTGPITVDPAGQNRGVGARLMQDVIARSARQGAAGVRLLQAGFQLSSADAQSRGSDLVPEGRPEAGLSDDADEHRSLQRADRRLHAVRSLLRQH